MRLQAGYGEPDFDAKLSDLIAAWTLTGPDDRILPINQDTVGQLLIEDVERIVDSFRCREA